MEEIVISAYSNTLIPTRAHETDAWFDICARDNYIIPPHWFLKIPVGVKVAMPNGIVCLVVPRSSLFSKKWLLLTNSVWIVDAWYRGEIMMSLYNVSDREAVIEYWERIWQLIFTNYTTDITLSPKFESFEEEYPSDRGANWFGSTGK